MKHSFILLFTFLISLTGLAQSVKISGEIRPRTEYAHGFGTLSFKEQDPAVNTTQRSRININYSDMWFNSMLVVQDVRRWGNQPQLVGNEDFATSIHQAWAEAYFLKNYSAKIGRQELSYDNHRILGNVGWAQQARSHDLVLFKYDKDFTLHLGIAHHDDGNLTQDLYFGPDAYRNMQFLWFNKQWDNSLLSFLILNNGVAFNKEFDAIGNVTDQVDKYSQTFGPYFKWTKEEWMIESNFYLQTGQNPQDQDLFAYEWLINGSYDLDENWTIGAGFEWLSGTKWDETSDDNTFNPLYGTNHKFNGFMDYFYVGNDGNNAGLVDAILRGKYKKDRFIYSLDYHIFWTDKEVNAGADKFLGMEIDLGFGYNISQSMQIQAGYSHLWANSTMRSIKGGAIGATHNWAYLMLTFKPVFYNNK